MGDGNPRIVQCPSCKSPISSKTRCESCDFMIDHYGDVLDLRLDKTFDTILDTANYDDFHGVDRDISHSFGNYFYGALDNAGIEAGGRVLEIACGSGLLTASLVSGGKFDEVHCGDISLEFMEILSKRIDGISTKSLVNKYLFDANHLPFCANSFDFVFGNSVLHHFSHFENTLKDTFRVLKAGGAAVFGEPILDTHVFSCLAAGMISRAIEKGYPSTMDQKSIRALKVIRGRASVKMENLTSDRSNLGEIEDKFQFPILYLREIIQNIGFEKMIFSPPPLNMKLGNEARKGIERVFLQIGAATSTLNDFDFVFESISNDYGKPMAPYMQPLFSHFVLVK